MRGTCAAVFLCLDWLGLPVPCLSCINHMTDRDISVISCHTTDWRVVVVSLFHAGLSRQNKTNKQDQFLTHVLEEKKVCKTKTVCQFQSRLAASGINRHTHNCCVLLLVPAAQRCLWWMVLLELEAGVGVPSMGKKEGC